MERWSVPGISGSFQEGLKPQKLYLENQTAVEQLIEEPGTALLYCFSKDWSCKLSRSF